MRRRQSSPAIHSRCTPEDGSRASIAAVSRNGGVVTLLSSANLPAESNGRAVAIGGVSDSSYTVTFVVKITGPNTLTYTQDYGDNGSSSGEHSPP